MRVCAVHAIKDEQGSIYVETDDCVGCGCCKTLCIQYGLKALEDKTTEWLKGAA
jgi:Fe-S-cluster-containing hydrogenase component 2